MRLLRPKLSICKPAHAPVADFLHFLALGGVLSHDYVGMVVAILALIVSAYLHVEWQ